MEKGRKRNFAIKLRLNLTEYRRLKVNSKKAKITRSNYLRRLIMEYKIKEQPDEKFYDLMSELIEIGNTFKRLSDKSDFNNYQDKEFYKLQSEKINSFINEIRNEYM